MTLAAWKRQVQVGTILRCIENTYRPELNGTTRTMTKVGATVAECESNGVSGFRMEWPKARDVVRVDGSAITYRIRGDYLVTLAVES